MRPNPNWAERAPALAGLVSSEIGAKKSSGALNPVGALPDHGIVTKADAHLFTAEWPG